MEVITLVLILLSSVGARNIPGHMDQPSKVTLVFDGQPSYMKTPITTVFPTGELVESVYVADLEIHLNENTEDDEKDENHVKNVMSLDNDIIGNMDTHEPASYEEKKVNRNKQEEETYNAVRPVEAIEGHNNQNSEGLLLEDRDALKAGCINGTVRFGDVCKLVV